MNERWKHPWIFLLLAIGWLIATNQAMAESKSTGSKRSFATLLARQATVAAPRAAKVTVAKERVAHGARAASVKPLTSRAVYGVTAATNVVPPSGYGSGRDAFVEALYPQILARAATQSDVDYWARVLYSGTKAYTVAEDIWNSQEHKTLERSGEAPDIPFKKAYARAYDWGLLHCKEREAAERRRQEAIDRRLRND